MKGSRLRFLTSPLLVLLCIFYLQGCSKREADEKNAVTAAPVAPVAEAQPPDKLSVRMPIPIVEAGQTTFYVAEDLGYYREQGIEVQFELASKELNPVKMVAAEKDQFAILGGPDTLLVARSRGLPLKAIAVIHRNSNFPVIITLKSSGITRAEQLQGKKVGFNYGHISTDVIRNLLRKTGVTVTEVDVGFNYSQLLAGQIDAEWAFTVTAGLELPAKGTEINIISPADYGIHTHGYTIFTTEKMIAEHPDLVKRFLRASLKGVVETNLHPETAVDILLRHGQKLDRDLNIKRQQMYNAVTSIEAPYYPGYMDLNMFKETYERLLEEGVIEKSFDVNEAFTSRFVEEIHKENTH